MFYKIRRMSFNQREALKMQMKLAMCAFYIAVFLAILSIFYFIFTFTSDTVIVLGDNAAVFLISCDLNTFSNVYLLLFTCKVVRVKAHLMLRRLFCCKTDPPPNKSVMAKSNKPAVKRRWIKNPVQPMPPIEATCPDTHPTHAR